MHRLSDKVKATVRPACVGDVGRRAASPPAAARGPTDSLRGRGSRPSGSSPRRASRGLQLVAGAGAGVHRPLGVGRDQDQAAAGRRAAGQRRGFEPHPEREHVVGEDVAQLVVGDLADEAGAAAQARRPRPCCWPPSRRWSRAPGPSPRRARRPRRCRAAASSPWPARARSRNASSQVAMTSTIASPIATMSSLGEVTAAAPSRARRGRVNDRKALQPPPQPLRLLPMTSEVQAAARGAAATAPPSARPCSPSPSSTAAWSASPACSATSRWRLGRWRSRPASSPS